MADYNNHDESFTSEESGRLFSDEIFSIEIVHASRYGMVDSTVAQNVATLEDELSMDRVEHGCILKKAESGFEVEKLGVREALMGSHTIFFIKQSDSWSRIHMSYEAFQKLVSTCSISDDIYPFIRAFGSRIKDSDTSFGGYFRRLHRSLNNGYHQNAAFCEQAQIERGVGEIQLTPFQAEFCFSVRYPDKHGRDLEDPWVMRRILVYQQHNLDSQNSTWILLQCPPLLKNRLISTLSVANQKNSNFIEHINLHKIILGEVFKGWRGYINHLEAVVEEVDEIACFSRVGQPHPFDYRAKFADAQLLQQYMRMILKAREAIETSLSVIEGLIMHINQAGWEEEVDRLPSPPQALCIELEQFARHMELHRRSVATLAEYSLRLQTLLLNLLGYRNDETVHQNGEIVHQDGETLKRIATSTQMISEEQTELLQNTVKDYRIMKSLTYIAVLYLPANLIAAIFNSNLLSVPSAPITATDDADSLSVSKGIWLFFVLSLSLTLVTLLATVPWSSLRASAAFCRRSSPGIA